MTRLNHTPSIFEEEYKPIAVINLSLRKDYSSPFLCPKNVIRTIMWRLTKTYTAFEFFRYLFSDAFGGIPSIRVASGCCNTQ